MGARCRAIKQLDQMCCLTEFRQHLKECFEYPGAAQSPEPLPYVVPIAIFAGECAPCYAVYGEVVDGLEKFTVVIPRLSPARLRRIKHFQHDRPVALRHSCQHVRPSAAGHAVIRTKPDSGTRQKCMSGIPSTRPSAAKRCRKSTVRVSFTSDAWLWRSAHRTASMVVLSSSGLVRIRSRRPS